MNQLISLITTLIGIWLGVAAGLNGLIPLSILAAIAATCSAVWGFQDAQPYTITFSMNDWKVSSSGFEIKISSSRHKRGKTSSVTVQTYESSGYHDCFCDVRTEINGNIILGASGPFSGRVIIR
jgi:hypothetical protein